MFGGHSGKVNGMKRKKSFGIRLLAIILALVMLLPLAACERQGGGDTTTGAPPETELPTEAVTLDLSDYKIVAEKNYNDDYRDCIDALRTGIKERVGVELDVSSDFIYSTTPDITKPACEILVGNTNRPESVKYLSELRENDYLVTYENERVVILGGNAASTMLAVEYFLDNFVHGEDKVITVYTNRVDIIRYEYEVGLITLNGVRITDYSIVYSSDDILAKYAAENFAAALRDAAGVVLPVVSDVASEFQNDREILIGATDRSESIALANAQPADGEYLLSAVGTKIVALGNGYMVGGGVSALLNDMIKSGEYGADISVTVSENSAAKEFVFLEARSAILMIGDGMGRNHILSAEKEGMEVFYADTLPVVGTCTTYSYSVKPLGTATYTDSAASATALATGYKTINGYVGLDNIRRSRQNVRELAASKGAKTAVLTTDVITGATPAGFTAHTNSRTNTQEIQDQINALISDGNIDFCEGSVDNALTSKAAEALSVISADGSSFFMMLEEAYIDKNSHNNDYDGMVMAVNRYNDAIAYVIEFVLMHPDTVLIITADHETGGVTKLKDNTFKFTRTTHSNADVPIFALGGRADTLLTDSKCDNTDVAKFIASVFGENAFGRQD